MFFAFCAAFSVTFAPLLSFTWQIAMDPPQLAASQFVSLFTPAPISVGSYFSMAKSMPCPSSCPILITSRHALSTFCPGPTAAPNIASVYLRNVAFCSSGHACAFLPLGEFKWKEVKLQLQWDYSLSCIRLTLQTHVMPWLKWQFYLVEKTNNNVLCMQLRFFDTFSI